MTRPRVRRSVVVLASPTLAVSLFVVVAMILRMYFLWGQCFRPGYVNFQETDPWYHVRAVEHLVANFPHRLTWDPYALYPGGQYIAIGPLFDLMVTAVVLDDKTRKNKLEGPA